MFDEVLELIKQPSHDINVNEWYDSGLTPLHIATAGGALVSDMTNLVCNPSCHHIHGQLCSITESNLVDLL